MIHDLDYLSQHDGVLHIDGISVENLADMYGTPLYVYSKKRVLQNYERLKSAFDKAGVPVNIHYAVKCNSNLAILHWLREVGCGADVSCLGEIELVRHAGFSSDKIIYTGNNNPTEELGHSLKYVDKVNLDDISALPRLLQSGRPKILSFRLNPGVGSASHESLVFAGKQSKFGVDPETALYGYQMAKKAGVERFGIHMMPGTGGLDPDAYPNATRILVDTMKRIHEKTGITFEFMNIGGGFGIPYRPEEKALDMDTVAARIGEIYKEVLRDGRLGQPTLDSEPGRYLVGDAGVLLGRIHTIKKSYRTYAGMDAGMAALLRPAMYKAYHHILPATRMDQDPTENYVVCGQICENADQHPDPRRFPELQEGDVLAVLNAGAYGYSMSMPYNNQPRPAEVMVSEGRHALIRRRETVTDLMRSMVVPV